jgi:hypothetical protein
MRGRIAAAGIGLALALCSLACATPPTEDELDAELRQIAREVKPQGQLRIVSILAESRMDAWAKLAEDQADGKEAGPAQPARRLIRAFDRADRFRVAVVTGGPYADWNERMVRAALDAGKGKQMPGLTLVYVSPEPPSDELRAAVSRAGSLLVPRTLPEHQ